MNFWEILVLVVLLIANGWAQWWFAYMKKDGEYLSLKENINGVLKEVESMKSDIDVIKDGKIHLQREARSSMFDMSDAAELYFNSLDELAHIADDESATPILKNMTQAFLTYIRKRNRYMLLNDVPDSQINLEQTLIKSLTALKDESLKYIYDSGVCTKSILGSAFDVYLNGLNQIHNKHDKAIINNLREFNKGIGAMLKTMK